MDTETLNKKIELIQWLSTIEDHSLIEELLKFRTKKSKDWWDAISVEEKQSIEQGILEANEDKLESHSTVRKMYEKWL